MKAFIFLIAVFFSMNLHAAPSVGQVRELFKKAISEKKSCSQLIEMLKGYNETNNPLFAGYKACATMVMAKHVFNPAAKFSYFSSGKQLLEKTIASDPANTELKFLRFGIQTNLPSLLNYRQDIKTDKAFLIRMLPYEKDSDLKTTITSYLLRSSYVTAAEKHYISVKMHNE